MIVNTEKNAHLIYNKVFRYIKTITNNTSCKKREFIGSRFFNKIKGAE